jgi:hypothetical protein
MKETKILALSTLRRRSGGDELIRLWSLDAAQQHLCFFKNSEVICFAKGKS